jgi:hypothetical protein
MKNIEERIAAIELRNNKVELDKGWETSWTRKLSIMILTYLVVVCYLHFVVRIDPWINALVPVIGYFLSTLTIGLIKRIWAQRKTS